ncbi:MAG: adenylate/guanylate cyclase domain-containing protein [Deltaproteobacteria bacterium]|nr:adenylate/guanylate cyclase domain-containing protein [Deltaproteobacteria bacterium]
MTGFKITPFSISVLNVFVLILFMVYFLLRGKEKSQATWYLIVFMSGVSLVFLSFFVLFSSQDPKTATVAWWVLHTMVFSAIAMVQFAYHFPVNLHVRESRIALLVTIAAACAAYPFYLYQTMSFTPCYNFGAHLYVFYKTPQIGIVIGMEILWMLVVFLRKTWALSGYGEQDFPGRGGNILYAVAMAWKRIIHPRRREARALRNLTLLFLSPVLLIAAIVMAYSGRLSWEIVAHILGTGFIFVVLLFIIFYINNSSEPSTFMVKLIGISLGTILTVFGLVANLALQIRDNAYDNERLIETDQCRIAIQSADYKKAPKNVAFILEHRLDEAAGPGKDILRYASYDAGLHQTGLAGIISGIREAKTSKHISGTTGRFRKYFSLPPYRAADFFVYYEIQVSSRLFRIVYRYADYRNIIHRVGLVCFYIIVGIIIFVIAVFPAFFHESLVKPLNLLLDGVKNVNNGNLAVTVPVHVADEIGFLSSSFNNMVKSIRTAEAELKGSLDHQVLLTDAYSCFVPREFLKFLKKDSIIDIRLGDNVQKEMTLLFSDIRSFTELSEKMTPQENFSFLNHYLEKVGPVIRKNNGFIDKYIGDAIMAIFPDKPEDAVRAALAMRAVLEGYNQGRGKAGYDPIHIGIGIHSGTMMLGTIGEEKRMEGTVISDAVNLAARLEGLTKLYGADIIVSRYILDLMDNRDALEVRFLDSVQVKGRIAAIDIFEVLATGGNGPNKSSQDQSKKLGTRERFEEGVALFKAKKFDEALSCFESVLRVDDTDRAAALFIKRIRAYQASGVPENWEGVTVLDEK